jgi:hypothetical protein
VAVPKEFANDLAKITEQIRADWLKDAPADAKAIYEEYLKKVNR